MSKMNPDLGTGNRDLCQRRETFGAETCDCDGFWPHAPGWQDEITPAYAPSDDPRDFDHVDRLNEDGTVTLRMSPSTWHRYPIQPDTYHMFTGDSWVEYEMEYLSTEATPSEVFGEEFAWMDDAGIQFEYDHFNWEYDHAAIVRALSEELANWMAEELADAGLTDVQVELIDTWSPQFYNFTTDGFEVEVTCSPADLRELTPDFNVDEWGKEFYSSYDGFASFVPHRLEDDDWHAEYDGGFRVEALLAAYDDFNEREWIMRLAENEHEIYMEHVKVTPDVERIREEIGYMESGYTLAELEEWARELQAEYQFGMDPLPGMGAA